MEARTQHMLPGPLRKLPLPQELPLERAARAGGGRASSSRRCQRPRLRESQGKAPGLRPRARPLPAARAAGHHDPAGSLEHKP
jgi:hypothetical protein